MRKTLATGVVAAAVLLGAVLSDWPTGWLSHVWANYSVARRTSTFAAVVMPLASSAAGAY